MTEQSHQLSRYLSDGMIRQAIRQSRVTEVPCNDGGMNRLLETLLAAERGEKKRHA